MGLIFHHRLAKRKKGEVINIDELTNSLSIDQQQKKKVKISPFTEQIKAWFMITSLSIENIIMMIQTKLINTFFFLVKHKLLSARLSNHS